MQQIHPTKTSRIGDIALAIMLALGIVCAFVLAQHQDDLDDAETQRLAVIERENLALRTRVEINQKLSAYEAGLADAMEAMRGTPQGVQLAQACMALQQTAGAR